MGTDRYAYQSRLRRVSPLPKLALAAVALVVCLCCDSVWVGLTTVVVMGILITALGGLPVRVYLHFLKVPLAFLVIGGITILGINIGIMSPSAHSSAEMHIETTASFFFIEQFLLMD